MASRPFFSYSAFPGLVRHAGGGSCGSGRIAEVVVADRFELFVEFVDERDPCRDVAFDDVRVGDVVEELDERPQAVAVGRNQYTLARANHRRQRLVPVGKEPRDGVLERFGQRQFVWRERGVASIP